jgi:hypothetical protein
MALPQPKPSVMPSILLWDWLCLREATASLLQEAAHLACTLDLPLCYSVCIGIDSLLSNNLSLGLGKAPHSLPVCNNCSMWRNDRLSDLDLTLLQNLNSPYLNQHVASVVTFHVGSTETQRKIWVSYFVKRLQFELISWDGFSIDKDNRQKDVLFCGVCKLNDNF